MIKYELFKNLKIGKKQSYYHPRVKLFGTQSSKAIEEDVSKVCTATRGDIQLVFTSISEKMLDYMLQGYAVNIKELGTFSVTLKSKSPIKNNDKAVNSVVTIKNIIFRPEKQFIEQLRHRAEFSFADSYNHDNSMKDFEHKNSETDKIIIDYIKENGFITRRMIQSLLNITRYKAYKHIDRMISEGKIINNNYINSSPVYVLSNKIES